MLTQKCEGDFHPQDGAISSYNCSAKVTWWVKRKQGASQQEFKYINIFYTLAVWKEGYRSSLLTSCTSTSGF